MNRGCPHPIHLPSGLDAFYLSIFASCPSPIQIPGYANRLHATHSLSTNLATLHWLDVPERIEYKVGAMLYRCLHGQAPRYLADNLIPASDAARCTPSSSSTISQPELSYCTVPRCRLSTYGCRAFDYVGPTVWNSLADELRNSDSFDNFKQIILFSRY